MAWRGNFMCVSFLKECLEMKHDLRSHTFKIALYDEDAGLDYTTTDYSATNEVSGTGYTAGGQAITAVAPTTSGATAYANFADVTFSNVTLSARGALIYNTTTEGGSGTTEAVMVLDFGRTITKTAEDLVITVPTSDALNALIRLTAQR